MLVSNDEELYKFQVDALIRFNSFWILYSYRILYCITQTKTELSFFHDFNTSLTVKFVALKPRSLPGIVSKQILPNQVFRYHWVLGILRLAE